VPRADRFAGRSCQGVRVRLTDRNSFDAPAFGIELASALLNLYPGKFDLGNTTTMIGSQAVVQAIKNGEDPRQIRQRYQPELASFIRKRQNYLLY
jgi:uncharacterized protein YbbC (DUF1343 family)